MQQLARDEAGNVWQVDAAGNPVALVQPAGGGPQPMTIGAPDPAAAFEAPKADVDLQRARIDAQRAAATAPYEGAKAKAETTNLQLEAQKRQQELANPSKDEQARKQQISSLNQLIRQINETESLYRKGAGATTGIAGVKDYLPYNVNRQLDTAGKQLGQIGLGAFRQPGGGEITDSDARLFNEANVPSAGSPDAVTEQQLKGIKMRAEEQAKALGMAAPQWAVATGATRTERDPKASKLIDTLIRRGASADEINAAIGPLGFDPVTPQSVSAAQAYLKKNPGYKGVIGDATREVGQGILNRAAGSAGGAAFTGYLNGATGGFIDEAAGALDSALSGRPLSESIADFDARKQASGNAFPGASFAGNLLGGATGILAGGGVANGLGIAARLGTKAPLVGDLAFGALSGAGESNDNRLLGAGVGTLGAGIGRGLVSGAGKLGGRLVGGGGTPESRYLTDRGVDVTGGGVLGGRFKALEDKLVSLPLAGDLIKKRQDEALLQANRAGANEALAPIGKQLPADIPIGPEHQRFGEQAFNDAYDRARSGMTFIEDPQYRTDVFNLQRRADAGELTPESAKRLGNIVSNSITRRLGPNSGLSGDAYKQATSEIGKIRKTTADPELRSALGELQDIFDGAATRHSSPDAVAQMQAADQGYARWRILADASQRTGGDVGTWTPAQLQQSVRMGDSSAGHRRFNQGQALLQDFSNAVSATLPAKVPNSGTADRLAALALPGGLGLGIGGAAGYGDGGDLGSTATGAGLGTATAGLGLGTVALLNTRAGRALAVKAIAERGPVAQAFADRIERAAPRLGGMFGRAIGTASTLPLLR